jgi:hypothetical protein
MAWHTTPLLREPYVCTGACQHTDCAEGRRVATSRCRYCDLLIGEGVKYFLDPPDQSPVHADCVWAREDTLG